VQQQQHKSNYWH